MIIFVHGVPETAAIWDKVRRAITRESIAVSLPGFATPRPPDFEATKDAYAEWLLGEIEQVGEPVDLVGHDWGAGLTYRIATAFGDRLRSWAADVANIAHPDYVWHDIAQLWQTPGAGEEFVAAQVQQEPAERAALYQAFGLEFDDALEMAEGYDATMGGCILDLYRSATPNPYATWGPMGPTAAPGLVLHPTEDPFCDEQLGRGTAELLGAGFAPIEGANHFWPYQAPEVGAAVLESFWATLD